MICILLCITIKCPPCNNGLETIINLQGKKRGEDKKKCFVSVLVKYFSNVTFVIFEQKSAGRSANERKIMSEPEIMFYYRK